ncbi:hypothetical protein POM88_033506 [Heracleum sosnowskyi]|uniref:Uncharacterized protein n=1 Tax=Heracleum sosnowskyi TaxID=360622 RepID=A0AAD8MME0_9APIA|nr:hypothetical protein POM88_033506 [Heracleum sosnowskyi]
MRSKPRSAQLRNLTFRNPGVHDTTNSIAVTNRNSNVNSTPTRKSPRLQNLACPAEDGKMEVHTEPIDLDESEGEDILEVVGGDLPITRDKSMEGKIDQLVQNVEKLNSKINQTDFSSDSSSGLSYKTLYIRSQKMKEQMKERLKSRITLLQKQAVSRAQDVNKEIIVLQERISDKETEINRLNGLLQIEKHRADSERKKYEQKGKEVDEKEAWAEKLLAEHEREMVLKEAGVRLPLENEISSLKSQIELLQQQVVSDRAIAANEKLEIERGNADCLGQQLKEEIEKVEEARIQLERLRAEVGDLRANMEADALTFKQANEKLEIEAKREKERADSEMRKAEYQRKVAEAYGEKERVKTNQCEQMAQELETGRCETQKLKKEIDELVSSRKLLKKELKLERKHAKHAKQIASSEKEHNILVRQKICRIKEECSRISDHLDILDKCSSHRDVGLNKPEKNCNSFRRQGTKRKSLDDELCQVHYSGNELMKPSSTLDDSIGPIGEAWC